MGCVQFKEKFQEAIIKYINSVYKIDEYNAKTDILILVEQAGKECKREEILEVLEHFWHLPADLMDYFIPGSLFVDGNLAFGWYRPDQVIAEFLPVKLSKTYDRGFFNVMEVVWNRDGFQVAVSLPLARGPVVSIPAGQNNLFARYGWAAPVELQWYRTSDSYIVYRSIIYCGFCRAWRLRPDASEYYAKHPPDELRQILDYSGEPAIDF